MAAVLGGRNIGDEYFGQDPSFNFQDMDAIALGDVAAEAGRAFDLFWNAELAFPVEALNSNPEEMPTTAQSATLSAARERVRPRGEDDPGAATTGWLNALSNELLWTEARVIVDRPDRSTEQPDSAFMALAQDPSLRPTESVVIQTAYLIPNGPTMGNIEALSDQGVELKILTNSAQSNNHNSVHAFYVPYRKRLIEAGVDLYEVQGNGSLAGYLDRVGEDGRAGLHTKASVIDERIALSAPTIWTPAPGCGTRKSHSLWMTLGLPPRYSRRWGETSPPMPRGICRWMTVANWSGRGNQTVRPFSSARTRAPAGGRVLYGA